MRLLVLGGTGFVSRRVAQMAMAAGNEVFCVTRGSREPVPGAKTLIADRNDPAGLTEALHRAGGTWDAVLDCICYDEIQAQVDMSVLPAFTGRLIVISTDSVYHPDYRTVPRNEEAPTYMEGDSYGAKKRRMELAFLRDCPDSLRWTIFRPPHIYGAGSELGCFPDCCRKKDLLSVLRSGTPLRLVEGGEYLLQPLYVGDLARAMLASIRNPRTEGQIFCIAGPDVIPCREYFALLGELAGLPVQIEEMPRREFEDTHDNGYQFFCQRVYDLTKLRTAGLPVPTVGLRRGLKEQLDALLASGR